MSWEFWPQYLVIAVCFANFAISLGNLIEKKTKPTDFVGHVVWAMLVQTVLYCGGFYG